VLTGTGRRLRGFATAAVVGLLLAGTFWGEDDHFPFGPFRMYAVTTRPDGSVSSLRLEGTDTSGRDLVIPLARVAMRRAELQSQLSLYWRDDADALPYLAEGYERLQPDAPELVELRFVYATYELSGGGIVGEPSERTAAVWKRPGR